MEIVEKVAEFFSSPQAVLLFAVLFALSEFLASYEKVASNSIFQAVVKVLKWVKEKLAKKPSA